MKFDMLKETDKMLLRDMILLFQDSGVCFTVKRFVEPDDERLDLASIVVLEIY